MELGELAAGFVALANDSCGISLSQEQIADVTRLFDSVLPTFFVVSQDCDLLTQTVVESGVAEALATVRRDPGVLNNLVFSLATSAFTIENRRTLLADRISSAISALLLQNSVTVDASSAARAAVDDILFTVNDFCGVPTLSDVTLALLNEYYEIVVNSATTQTNVGRRQQAF